MTTSTARPAATARDAVHFTGMPPDIGTSPPWPWDWARMSPGQAEDMWETLEAFVGFLDARYAWTADQLIPGCWAEHGALVEELTNLFWSRHLAYEGPKPTIDLAQAWHQQNLAGFYQRLRWWLGDSGRDCRAGHHPDQSPAVQAVQAKTEAEYTKRRRQLITLDGRWRAQRVVGADSQP